MVMDFEKPSAVWPDIRDNKQGLTIICEKHGQKSVKIRVTLCSILIS